MDAQAKTMRDDINGNLQNPQHALEVKRAELAKIYKVAE
jgi:hypothetical protein